MIWVVFTWLWFEQVLNPEISKEGHEYLSGILHNNKTYHPLRSASPRHNESVRTLRSISFFQSIPSEITLYHSLHTNSAAYKDSASR